MSGSVSYSFGVSLNFTINPMRQDSRRHSMEKETDPGRLKNYFRVKQLVSGRAGIGAGCVWVPCQLSLLCDLQQE